jgi:glyoxylase I family protein
MPLGKSNQIMAGLGSHHVALQTVDYEAAIAFYTEVMGMQKSVEFSVDGRRVALLDIGDGSHLELFEPLPDAPALADVGDGRFFHFALATSDITAALERVRAAGMEITTESKDAQLGPLDVTIAFFKGPSGEVVELFQVNN